MSIVKIVSLISLTLLLIGNIIGTTLLAIVAWTPESQALVDRKIQTVGIRAKVRISIDPRLELLAIVQLYSPWLDARGILKGCIYMDEALNRFDKWKDHKAVNTLRQLINRGFGFDAPVGLMVYLSNPPELKETTEFSQYLIGRAGGKEYLEEFVQALRDFALESEFMEFYLSHESFYDDVMRRSNLKEGQSQWNNIQQIADVLEDFFGMHKSRYHVILTPLIYGNYGHWIETDEGVEVFAFVCSTKIVDGFPVFEDIEYIVAHEFMHSFVNPITEKYIALINDYDYLYESRLASLAYPSWEIAINEYIIRASEIVIGSLYLGMGEDEVNRMLAAEESLGFTHIRAFYEAIRRYAIEERGQISFEEFYPKILEALPSREEVNAKKFYSILRVLIVIAVIAVIVLCIWKIHRVQKRHV